LAVKVRLTAEARGADVGAGVAAPPPVEVAGGFVAATEAATVEVGPSVGVLGAAVAVTAVAVGAEVGLETPAVAIAADAVGPGFESPPPQAESRQVRMSPTTATQEKRLVIELPTNETGR
jgi:hypothetical protein